MTECIASARKILAHRERIEAYLRGEFVYPVTLELDLTTACTRRCERCPSLRSSRDQHLSLAFINRLFAGLEGQTRGLLAAGGEPTMVPDFPEILALARRRGFGEISVVTNGSLLHRPVVRNALMEHASAVRISMYDWGQDACGGVEPTVRQVEGLRAVVERSGSPLQIGVSVLTWRGRASRLAGLTESMRLAGAHWIYFHPFCEGWEEGRPAQVPQDGVLSAIQSFSDQQKNGFNVFVSRGRYLRHPLEFEGYHAAHFLMVVGADGRNYLGAEVKYQDRHILADLNSDDLTRMIRSDDRRRLIASVSGETYPARFSRHRGVLYNHLLDMIRRRESLPADHREPPPEEFGFPNIL